MYGGGGRNVCFAEHARLPRSMRAWANSIAPPFLNVNLNSASPYAGREKWKPYRALRQIKYERNQIIRWFCLPKGRPAWFASGSLFVVVSEAFQMIKFIKACLIYCRSTYAPWEVSSMKTGQRHNGLFYIPDQKPSPYSEFLLLATYLDPFERNRHWKWPHGTKMHHTNDGRKSHHP